ncbi:MAG: MgtC/SapB family protein [Candidatus Aenigmatarchaeota archaeon]
MHEFELVIRLVAAVILGALVGIEREIVHKPAGLRTNILVCLGSSLITIVSTYYYTIDPARLAAGIVTGVGFLGAGAIIATKGEVKGITTAASIWAVAAIGITVGLGLYLLASVTAILVFIILELWRVE